MQVKLAQLIIVIILSSMLISCTNQHRDKADRQDIIVRKKATQPIPAPLHLYVKNDSLCIVTSNKTYCMPNDTTIKYKNEYAGIYEIQNGAIKKSYNLVLDKYLCFTTFDEVGMGYRGHLYIYDLNQRALINDLDFKHNYLYSSGGAFIWDKNANKIFSICKLEWYEKIQSEIASASMYAIAGKRFKYYKDLYQKDIGLEGDTSIVEFYKSCLENNGKHGLILPADWWK